MPQVNNLKLFRVINKKNNSKKILAALLTVASIILAGYTYIVWTTPLTIENKITENVITQTANIDYKADVIPSTLYPKGGTITPDETIFSNLTKSIRVLIDSSVTAEEPVTVTGKQKVSMVLMSEKQWQREFPLGTEAEFTLEGTNNEVLRKEYVVDIAPIQGFIESVQKETKVGSGEYYLKIIPEIAGNAIYKEQTIPLQEFPVMTLKIGSGRITLAKESQANAEKEVTNPLNVKNEFPIITTQVVPQPYSIFGWSIPLQMARYYALGLTIILFIAQLIIWKGLIPKPQVLSETKMIDRKYRKRLTRVNEKIFIGKEISMASFKSLLNLANEKEQPILRYKDSDGTVSYFIVSEGCVYKYQASNSMEIKDNPEPPPINVTPSGSEIYG